MGYYYGWRPYVPVAERRRQAKQELARLRKKGLDVQPIEIAGRTIAQTFWGQAWCRHFEALGDYENRLPRGRTYVRNGSVCHLAIERGHVSARVVGSELYEVDVEIGLLPKTKWNRVKSRCSGQIGSLLELLQGRLSDAVMQVVTNSREGLFPLPGEIELQCSCPDWAVMCKHVAAVLYGVAARLDDEPDKLFLLRGVDQEELIAAPADEAVGRATTGGRRRRIDAGQLSDVFGIDLDDAAADAADPAPDAAPPRRRAKPAKKTKKADARKRAPAKRAGSKKTGKKTTRRKAVKKTAVKKRAAKSTKKKPAKKKTGRKSAGSSQSSSRKARRKSKS